MKKMKLRTRLALLILVVLLLSAVTGFAVGKYRQTFPLAPNSVTFTAKLAESMTLQEHKAVRLSDGTYELDMSKTVAANEYILIPGVDIPKDPHITIAGRTSIPAYLFIEVTSTLNTDTQVYHVDDSKWDHIKTDGNTKVYCYKNAVTDGTIYILRDHPVSGMQIEIKQGILSNAESSLLEIGALLIEKVGDKTAADTYANN